MSDKPPRTITLSEEDCLMNLLALAELAMHRPGWAFALKNIAAQFDEAGTEGKPMMFSYFIEQNQSAPPLQWVWSEENLEFTARVPAKDHNGEGYFTIHAIKRPDYCDRGKWYVLVENYGVEGLDDSEGFPRYYFKLENLKEEMAIWASERKAVQEARKK